MVHVGTIDPKTVADEVRPDAPLPHVRVRGMRVFDGDMEAAVEVCLDRATTGLGAKIATANLDFFALAKEDPALREALDASSMVVADGAPVAWLARIAGANRARRIAGVDLTQELCRQGQLHGEFRVALYGATPEVNARAAAHIEKTYPGVSVVLSHSPEFRALTDAEEAEEQRLLRDAQPHAVFVALGCPRQELLIERYYPAVPNAVWMGVGGTLDFLAGAGWSRPRWLQVLGFEWLARLKSDPVRLWRRYFLRDLPMLTRLAPACLWDRLRSSDDRPEATSETGFGSATRSPETDLTDVER